MIFCFYDDCCRCEHSSIVSLVALIASLHGLLIFYCRLTTTTQNSWHFNTPHLFKPNKLILLAFPSPHLIGKNDSEHLLSGICPLIVTSTIHNQHEEHKWHDVTLNSWTISVLHINPRTETYFTVELLGNEGEISKERDLRRQFEYKNKDKDYSYLVQEAAQNGPPCSICGSP